MARYDVMQPVDMFEAYFVDGEGETFALPANTNFSDAIAYIVHDRIRRNLNAEITDASRTGVARARLAA